MSDLECKGVQLISMNVQELHSQRPLELRIGAATILSVAQRKACISDQFFDERLRTVSGPRSSEAADNKAMNAIYLSTSKPTAEPPQQSSNGEVLRPWNHRPSEIHRPFPLVVLSGPHRNMH